MPSTLAVAPDRPGRAEVADHRADGRVHDKKGDDRGERGDLLFPLRHADSGADREDQRQVVEHDRARGIEHLQNRVNGRARPHDAEQAVGLEHGLVGERAADAEKQAGDRQNGDRQHKRAADTLQYAEELILHVGTSFLVDSAENDAGSIRCGQPGGFAGCLLALPHARRNMQPARGQWENEKKENTSRPARRTAGVFVLCTPHKILLKISSRKAACPIRILASTCCGRLCHFCAPRTKIRLKFRHAGGWGTAGFAFVLPQLPEKPLCRFVPYFARFDIFPACILHFRSLVCHQKKVLALVLAFACAFTMFAGAAFTDQADIETADAVDTLVALGVIDGYEDGSFQPDVTVNRAEMAKMIYTILNGGNDDASAYENLPTSFTDLAQEGWATGYIKYLQNTGIIAGKTVTQFAPSDTVTGVEAAKMMLVAAGYSADKAGLEGSAWIANTMRYANMNNLFDGVSCDVNSGLPRQYAAQIMYNSLDMENVVYSNDIEGFKPATDVNEDKTIGGKYMDLITYEGILSGSGEFGTGAGKDKIAMDPIMKINGDASVRDDSGKYLNDTWDYEEDVTDLVGQYVKVQTGKDDKVYGVFAVASENTVVTTTISKLDTTKWDSGKIEIDGTEYRIADDFDTKIAGNISFADKKGIADLKELRSGDLITFISNDGDNKFDSAYANVMKAFGEVSLHRR